jgi:hypothetical protein
MKSQVKAIAALAICGIYAAGCGGSGHSGGPPTSLTQQQVLDLLQHGIGQSVAMVGSQSASASKVAKPNAQGTMELVYDEVYGLWALFYEGDPDNPDAPSGEQFFADEQGTQEAGYAYTWVSSGLTTPSIIRMETKIAAGPYSGLDETTILKSYADEHTTVEYDATYPNEGRFEYSGTWDIGGQGTVTGKYTKLDGSWEEYAVIQVANAGAHVVFDTSAGVKVDLQFDEDLSGEGVITGNGENLPATLVWDTESQGTITWADATTSEIYIPNLYGG